MTALSIITINLNNSEGLKRTIESVITQNLCNKIEFIIIDGGSTDDSKSIIEKYKNYFYFTCIEKDNGIFDAMNKGIKVSTGDFIYFLNSGDTFCDNYVLHNIIRILIENNNENIVCGKVKVYDNGVFMKLADVRPWLPHQGAFVKKDVMARYMFDDTLKIFGDLDLWYRLKLNNQYHPKMIDLEIASMEMDGIGNNPNFFKKRIRDKKQFYYKHNKSYLLLQTVVLEYSKFIVYKLFGKYFYHNVYIKTLQLLRP